MEKLLRIWTSKFYVAYDWNVYKEKNNNMKMIAKSKAWKWYISVRLWNDIWKKYLHRIVAEMYILNPSSLSEVNHKDWNKENNSADNLERCSRKDNVSHSRHILWNRVLLEKRKKVKKVMLTLLDWTTKIFESAEEAWKYTNTSGHNIRRACNRLWKTCNITCRFI